MKTKKIFNNNYNGLQFSEPANEQRQNLSKELKEVRQMLLRSQTHERRFNRNMMGFNLH